MIWELIKSEIWNIYLSIYKTSKEESFFVRNQFPVYLEHLREKWTLYGNYLFNKIDTGLQVHTEVDKLPLDTLLFVFFLFQDKHVVVEELLQSFIGVVDTQLFECVVLEYTIYFALDITWHLCDQISRLYKKKSLPFCFDK